MARYGKIENGVVANVVSTTEPEIVQHMAKTSQVWVELPAGVRKGALYDGTEFTAAVKAEVWRTRVTAGEFVYLWSAGEWGKLNELAGTHAVVRQHLDAVRWAGEVDMAGERMTEFMAQLLSNTPLTGSRATEIAKGVQVS